MDAQLILFGSTGDLAKAKILPALKALGVSPFLHGRKDVSDRKYIKGELHEIADQIKHLHVHHAYVALPPQYYEIVLKELSKLSHIPRIALEKPFGSSLEEAKKLIALIHHLKLEKKLYLVDHYLGKPALVEKKSFDRAMIKCFSIEAFETMDVNGRGAFYDAVGTIRDFVQSHILAIISTLLMQQGSEVSSSVGRQDVLKDIRYKEHSLLCGQYEGYRKALGVHPHSTTETYVSLTFNYDDLFDIDVKVGKALDQAKTQAKIIYKDGREEAIDIQSKANSYEKVLKDFLSDLSHFSLSYEESLRCWEITEQILQAKAGAKLVVYPQGKNPEKIG